MDGFAALCRALRRKCRCSGYILPRLARRCLTSGSKKGDSGGRDKGYFNYNRIAPACPVMIPFPKALPPGPRGDLCCTTGASKPGRAEQSEGSRF